MQIAYNETGRLAEDLYTLYSYDVNTNNSTYKIATVEGDFFNLALYLEVVLPMAVNASLANNGKLFGMAENIEYITLSSVSSFKVLHIPQYSTSPDDWNIKTVSAGEMITGNKADSYYIEFYIGIANVEVAVRRSLESIGSEIVMGTQITPSSSHVFFGGSDDTFSTLMEVYYQVGSSGYMKMDFIETDVYKIEKVSQDGGLHMQITNKSDENIYVVPVRYRTSEQEW